MCVFTVNNYCFFAFVLALQSQYTVNEVTINRLAADLYNLEQQITKVQQMVKETTTCYVTCNPQKTGHCCDDPNSPDCLKNKLAVLEADYQGLLQQRKASSSSIA